MTNTSEKKWLAVITAVGLMSIVFSTPTLQAVNPETALDSTLRREQLKRQIDGMRDDIKTNCFSFTVGFNPAMQFELSQLCTYNPQMHPVGPCHLQSTEPAITESLPSYYIGYYTPVKDQQSCGAGWAIASCGEFESVIKKTDGIEVDLSDQQLVSCNPYGWGCNGGNFLYELFVDPGAMLESCFPYVAMDIPCTDQCGYPYRAQGWAYVNPGVQVPSVEEIKQAIYNYGAVGAAVYVENFFQAYTGGLFDKCKKNVKWANHTIQLVGWDDSQEAWLLKNSWSTGWGENGFMWIRYGCNLVGSDANYVIY